MIWSDTDKLGCASHWCDELNIPGSTMVIRDALYLVCNYGPGYADVFSFLFSSFMLRDLGDFVFFWTICTLYNFLVMIFVTAR